MGNGKKEGSAFTSLRQPRSSNSTLYDKESPLETAKELQNRGSDGRYSNQRSEEYKKSESSASTISPRKRRKKGRKNLNRKFGATTLEKCMDGSTTLGLYSNHSDTNIAKKSSLSSPSPSSSSSEKQQVETRSKESKKFKNYVETAKKRRGFVPPSYPTEQLSQSTVPSQDHSFGECDSVITQNDALSSVIDLQEEEEEENSPDCDERIIKRKKKMEDSQNLFRKSSKTLVHDFEEQATKKATKNMECKIDAEPCSDKKQNAIGKMKSNDTLLYIPQLKKMIPRKRRKRTDDVKDMEVRYCENHTPSYLDSMKEVVDDAVNSWRTNHDLNDESKISRSAKNDFRTSNNSSSRLSIRRFNRTRQRSRKSPQKIIPGNSLKQKSNMQKGNDKELEWRSKKDQDDYHTSRKESVEQLYWNPFSGGNHTNTRPVRTCTIRSEGVDPLPQRRSKRKKKKPETIDILSSDSEDDDVIIAQKERNCPKFHLKRLAVGKKNVYNSQDHHPTIMVNTETRTMEIQYFKSKSNRSSREKLNMDSRGFQDFRFFVVENGEPIGLDVNLENFIFVKCEVYKKSINRKEEAKGIKEIVLGFEHGQEMWEVVSKLCPGSDPIDPCDIEEFAAPLISDSKKKYNLRRQTTPNQVDPFISNRPSTEILVVYPFGVEKKKMEYAANDLKELSWTETHERGTEETTDLPTSDTTNKSPESTLTTISQRSHFIEIRVEDYERLDNGQWLNDSLVDLWMQWISRDITCKNSSNVHFFTSHFYTTLTLGVTGVRSWTARKNINVFQKRLIFIPINKTLHWSLCVIVNPGAIENSSLDKCDDEIDLQDRLLPCMLFFDSLNMHRKTKVHKDVIKWLNSEWKHMKNPNEEPFSRDSFRIYDPQVPRQDNGSDCGVFVCRYAFAMFQLRHLKFSYRDAGLDTISAKKSITQRQREGLQSQGFVDLITNGKGFEFDVDDIQRIRCEFKTLIRKLHPLYQVAKDERIKAEIEEKKARKKKIKARKNHQRKMQEEDITLQYDSSTTRTPDEAEKESSDCSKDNRTPRQRLMHRANDEREEEASEPLNPESTEPQIAFGITKKDDSSRENFNDNDLAFNGENIPSLLSTPLAHQPTTGYVDREEMASNDDMVHF